MRGNLIIFQFLISIWEILVKVSNISSALKSNDRPTYLQVTDLKLVD